MILYPVQSLHRAEAERLINSIGVEKEAVPLLTPKALHLNIKISSLKSSWANIIKQEMLACGGDAAINRGCYACSVKESDVILMGTQANFARFISKMKMQPDCFSELTQSIERIIISSTASDKLKDFMVIGVLNVTPDSFSDGGKYNNYDDALKHAEQLVKDGANIIDIGGESTRPGSQSVSLQQEMDRVLPIIEAVKKKFDVGLSIDSHKPGVIRAALKAGVKMVNDVSGGTAVIETSDDIIKHNASVIIMMNNTKDDVIGSVSKENLQDPVHYFLNFCYETNSRLLKLGHKEERIIFDPGIGFGLSDEDTSVLLRNMSSAIGSGFKVCMGLSRKSYLGRSTGLNVDERDGVSNAISLYLMRDGVRIFRTHDVKGLSSVIKFFKSVEGRY